MIYDKIKAGIVELPDEVGETQAKEAMEKKKVITLGFYENRLKDSRLCTKKDFFSYIQDKYQYNMTHNP